MLNTINHKFHTIAAILVLLFGIVYIGLAYFIDKQSQSASQGQETVYLEREARSLQNLFFELRFWDRAVITQDHPQADPQFGALLNRIKIRLKNLDNTLIDDPLKGELQRASDLLTAYETSFNAIIQSMTEQRLHLTLFVSSYQALASTVLRSNEPSLLKPLFNLTQFQQEYLSNHRDSEYQAIKVVMNSLVGKIVRANLMDDHLKGYTTTYRELLEENLALELAIHAINKNFIEISQRLRELFADIALKAEIRLRNEFQRAEELRDAMNRAFLSFAVPSLMLLIFIIAVMAQKIVRPMKALAAVMREIKAGNIHARFRLAGGQKDEINQTGRALNEMLDTLDTSNQKLLEYQEKLKNKIQELALRERELKNHRHHLEESVEARTHELKKAVEQLKKEIHHRERVEAELKKHQEYLGAMVAERTDDLIRMNQELHQEMMDREWAEEEQRRLELKLLQAQKMEAIGTLAGGVAHDLNNILSGIVGYPELLLMDLPKKSPLRKPILTIKKSGEKAATIVQDLLTLARRGVSVTEVLNLNHIITEYLKSPECEKLKSWHPNITIETDFETNLLGISGSPFHLSKTVMNLVSNAAEAMPAGGKISIATRSRYIDKPLKGYDDVEEGDYIRLTVSDTGTGIAPSDLDRIFEPFYSKKKMGRSGTGLGMAVVWGTVKDHNGYIDVKSTEGKGTTFTIYFPVTRQELKTNAPLFHEDYMGNGESILVVDDMQEQRELCRKMLNKLDYAVDSVASGEDAIEYMKKNITDLLILDMIMDPGIDGLETFKEILKIHPRQKAIIASGFSETSRVKEAQELGARGYVRKPYTLEKIGLAVRNALAG